MAQADFIVSNGTGAAVRSDLNVQFAAIVSNNSGATEPATMYAYQWWADTTAGLLKIRNAANNAWVSLFELDGTFIASDISLGAGTVGAPSLFFTGDSNTGIYSPGADQLAVATNGVQRINIEADGDINIDGGGMFYDATNNRLAIGTTSPNERLDVRGKLYLNNGSASYFDAASSGGLIITNPTAVRWEVNSSERVRLDASGRLLVGTSTARSDFFNAGTVAPVFQVQGTGNNRIVSVTAVDTGSQSGASLILAKSRSTGNTIVQSGDFLGSISFQGSDGVELVAGATIAAVVDGTPGSNDLPTRLTFSVTADGGSSPTERMRIGQNGGINTYTDSANYFAVRNNGTSSVGNAFIVYKGATSVTNGTVCMVIRQDGDLENLNNAYGAYSDIKLKENIVDAASQWDDLKALQVRKYNFKPETGHSTHTQIGLVAQEVELVSPGLVSESPDRDAEGNDLGTVTKSVNYSVLYMKAVKALQEAMERIETLEARLTAAGIE
jgi:hypothetical protein